MRLSELQPRWIHPNVFVFLCPHCKVDLLSCKNVEMSHREQRELFEKEFGDNWSTLVVPMNPDTVWKIIGTLPEVSVSPSVDASASGHWHGNITNGEIVGGTHIS